MRWRISSIRFAAMKTRRWPEKKTADRGYGGEHQRLRKEWRDRVDASAVLCARCKRLILPGQPWDLDHTDDRAGYLGPSHARCNRAAAGRRKRIKQAFRISREW
jgi:hypothetical protein